MSECGLSPYSSAVVSMSRDRVNVAKNPDPIIIAFDDNYVENDYKRHYNPIFFATTNHNQNKNLFIIISDVIYNQKRSL